MYALWHSSPTQGVTSIVMDVDFQKERWEILTFRCYHQ
jgi:hypothetical protein